MGDETPQLPSSFPRSPSAIMRSRRPLPPSPTPQGHALPHSVGVSAMATASSLAVGSRSNVSPPSIIQTSTASLPPVIPLEAVDAPTQRLYAVGLFVLLQAWKFYDIARLYATDGDSISELWFCLKWLIIDGCFFWFLPLLRIPWLTFTPNFTLCTIAFLSVLDILLSLKYQVR
jgi:nucleoporin POM152